MQTNQQTNVNLTSETILKIQACSVLAYLHTIPLILNPRVSIPDSKICLTAPWDQKVYGFMTMTHILALLNFVYGRLWKLLALN